MKAFQGVQCFLEINKCILFVSHFLKCFAPFGSPDKAVQASVELAVSGLDLVYFLWLPGAALSGQQGAKCSLVSEVSKPSENCRKVFAVSYLTVISLHFESS